MVIAFVCSSNLIKVLNTLHENIISERQRKSEKLFLYIAHSCREVQRGLERADLFCILLAYWLIPGCFLYTYKYTHTFIWS